MPRLFAVYLGGRTSQCHIELHDIRFVVGETIDETIPALRQQWLGVRQGLHLDAYMDLSLVDGHEVILAPAPPEKPVKRLYFVNLGGYDPNKFTELHEFGFFVAGNPEEAKKRAKVELLQNSFQQHKDDLYDVDDCLALESVGEFHIVLRPTDKRRDRIGPDWFGYRRIDT